MSIFENRRLTFFDVETPNAKNASISSIGMLSLSSEGEIEEKYFLVNPEEYFDPFNIQLTGITPEMVKDQPNFVQVWKEIEPYFTGAVVVAHNATFDLNVLYKCFYRYGIEECRLNYLCTLALSRRYFNLPSYRLNALCETFNINLEKHHSADCDTKACFEIFLRINEQHAIQEYEIKTFVPSKSTLLYKKS